MSTTLTLAPGAAGPIDTHPVNHTFTGGNHQGTLSPAPSLPAKLEYARTSTAPQSDRSLTGARRVPVLYSLRLVHHRRSPQTNESS